MKTIDENLENKNKHYLYPFFWQKGQTNEKLKEYIDKMLEQGIHNMCIESRPHPEFLEDGWWKTMDFLIAEAKKNDMKIWILDDAKFPTGYANGKVPKELKKTYIDYHRFDIVGPNPHAEINLTCLCDGRVAMKDKRHLEDTFFKAILVENNLSEKDSFYEDSVIDVSHLYKDNILYLDLKNKHYSLFVIYKTICGEETTQDYLDPMRKESTQILINEVYEKHYQHYKDEFGNTIVGFFSDEPRFGNMKGTTASIGRETMPLPWNDEVYQLLQETSNYKEEYLPFLFIGKSQIANQLRFEYMNIVTKLYSQNFSQYIGNWCKERNVEYVGHTIEDNNAHARLGYGAGHYFRGLAGQTIAGIDIIGGQIVPGMNYHHDAFSTGGSDGEFYHHALVKLGASAAKLDSQKQGRLMCEAFGAYGWIEGLKMMQYITNHMLSHGVNIIVPHAFDPADFPDWDCPPHFYAHGNNPQYPYFHKWSHYADRLCHLMSDGYHYAKVGVLYHGFAEWSGDYMLIQKVLKELDYQQIGHDIISEDYLIDADISNNKYIINGYSYEVLVVPYAQRLPQELIDKLKVLSQHIKVIFINNYPENINTGEVSSLSKLSNQLIEYRDIITSSNVNHLTSYCYVKEGSHIYMFNNESVTEAIQTQVTINETDGYMIYDAYENKSYQLNYCRDENGLTFDLCLEPYQSLILVKGQTNNKRRYKGSLIKEFNEANISLKEYNQNTYKQSTVTSLDDYLGDYYPRFSGSIKYELEINCEQKDLILSLEEAYEIIEVRVDGKSVQTYIAPPYDFDISNYVTIGNNHIEIIATNNLSRNQRDEFSKYIPLEPLGINGKIKIYKKEEE